MASGFCAACTNADGLGDRQRNGFLGCFLVDLKSASDSMIARQFDREVGVSHLGCLIELAQDELNPHLGFSEGNPEKA